MSDAPVLGVSMGNVRLLRLDRTGGLAPGNKSFKLQGYIDKARRLGVRRLLSFGGAWSNHLHALAALGHELGFETVGIVRGEIPQQPSAMLQDARSWGMQLVPVTRAQYRLRNDADYQAEITARFAPCLLIPEGGGAVEGATGCSAIADLVRGSGYKAGRVVLPVGTGTTLAGLAAALDARWEVAGISALKGAVDLEQRVSDLLHAMQPARVARWRILHDFHCGGFARASRELRDFILAFEAVHGVPLEPVYTGKMLWAIQQQLANGAWDGYTPVLAIHTGGLQGRRGYPWLETGVGG